MNKSVMSYFIKYVLKNIYIHRLHCISSLLLPQKVNSIKQPVSNSPLRQSSFMTGYPPWNSPIHVKSVSSQLQHLFTAGFYCRFRGSSRHGWLLDSDTLRERFFMKRSWNPSWGTWTKEEVRPRTSSIRHVCYWTVFIYWKQSNKGKERKLF